MQLESISIPARMVFAACSLGLAAVIVALIRGNALREKYALLWMPLGAGFLLTSLFPEILLAISTRVRLHYMTVVVLAVILIFAAILLYLTVRMSQMREDIKTLAQDLALARAGRPAREDAPAPSEGWVPAPDARARSRA